MIEYYKNLDLADIVYTNEFGMKCTEIWKDIPQFVGIYKASDLGRLKILHRRIESDFYLNRFVQEKIKKQTLSLVGYLSVNTTNHAKKSVVYNVQILIAMAFLEHVPCGYEKIVDHKKKSTPLDNRLCNLQIITQRENATKDKENKNSKYAGVFKRKDRPTWTSSVRIGGDKLNLGGFRIEEDAHRFYLLAIEHKDKYNGNQSEFRAFLRSIF